MVVCCLVGAGNQSPVLWKNSKCSRLLSHLSSPFLLSVTLAYQLFSNQDVVFLCVSVYNVCMLACTTMRVWRSEGKLKCQSSHLSESQSPCRFSTVDRRLAGPQAPVDTPACIPSSWRNAHATCHSFSVGSRI